MTARYLAPARRPTLSLHTFPSNINHCVSVVADWMHSNRLPLNQEKTKLLWYTKAERHIVYPAGGPTIRFFPVRVLCVYIDSDLS